MSKLVLKLAIVFGGQSVMAWLFYRSRALLHSSWADSDLTVFSLPFAVGLTVSAWIMFSTGFTRMSTSKRTAVILAISAGGAVVDSFLGTVIGFNLYGT